MLTNLNCYVLLIASWGQLGSYLIENWKFYSGDKFFTQNRELLLLFSPDTSVFSTSKDLKIKIYKTLTVLLRVHDCETWSKGETQTKGIENRVLRRIFGPKRDENGKWRRLQNEELHNLYRLPNIKIGRVCSQKKVGSFKIVTGKPTGKWPHGRSSRR